ncbi:MAG: transposase, partial [Lentisphaeria bacterium]
GTKNKFYSPEFKILVILDMIKNNFSYSESRRRHGVSETNCLRNWHKAYLDEGILGLMKYNSKQESPKKDSNPESYEDLKSENIYLKMENEYLKKLSALVQKMEQTSKVKR